MLCTQCLVNSQHLRIRRVKFRDRWKEGISVVKKSWQTLVMPCALWGVLCKLWKSDVQHSYNWMCPFQKHHCVHPGSLGVSDTRDVVPVTLYPSSSCCSHFHLSLTYDFYFDFVLWNDFADFLGNWRWLDLIFCVLKRNKWYQCTL